MSADKAQEIINRAMADRRVYDAMAAHENEVWGEILPALERSEARIEDTKASAKLGVAHHQSSLFQVAQEKKLKFERGLTLGCGAGRLERALIHGSLPELSWTSRKEPSQLHARFQKRKICRSRMKLPI